MNFSTISSTWCGLENSSKIVIVTESERLDIAKRIKADNSEFVSEIKIYNIEVDEYEDEMKSLSENDLLIALFTIKGFMEKNYRNIFPSFSKPLGVKSKYVFIRLDIPDEALLTGLNTDFNKVENIISQLKTLENGSKVKVTSPSGTDITTCIKYQEVLPYHARVTGGNAFLPPPEVSEALYEDSTNGTIVVDVTVGELRINGEQIDELGIVDEPVIIKVKDGLVKEIKGGKIAERLKKGLSLLQEEQLVVVELGHGLSDIQPTGIIGVDESMNDTCHFGIGTGNPFHLDLVVRNPKIDRIY